MSSIGLDSRTRLRKEHGFGREVKRRQITWIGQVASPMMALVQTAGWRHGITMWVESGMINLVLQILVAAMVPSMPCVKLKNNHYKPHVCMHSYKCSIKGCNSTLLTCKFLSCPLYLSLFISLFSAVKQCYLCSAISFTGSDWCFWMRVPRRVLGWKWSVVWSWL